MDGGLDFLGSTDSIFLGEAGLSSLLEDCGDFDLHFDSAKTTQDHNVMEVANSSDTAICVATAARYSDHDYAGVQRREISDIARSLTDSSESLSDSGMCSSPGNTKSPGSSGGGSSPTNFMYEGSSSSPGSDDHSKISPFLLDDLTFGFGDADLEKIANDFMLDGDSVLESCLASEDRKPNEATCIQLDDELITADSDIEAPNVRNQIRINIPGVSIPDIFSVSGSSSTISTKPVSAVRCTLPNFKPLVLTEEEKKLLQQENVALPSDLPLTKSEERVLKRVRRKIRNKKSATESRKRRKEYLGGLESRVAQCTEQNSQLVKKVKDLENQNKSLLTQLKRLQDIVRSSSGITTKTTQATTCVMILLLSFGLFLAPNYGPLSITQEELPQETEVPSALSETHKSRSILEIPGAEIEEPLAKRPRVDMPRGVKQERDTVVPFYDGELVGPPVIKPPIRGVKREIEDGQTHMKFEGESARPGVAWKSIHDTAVVHQESVPVSIRGENNSSKNASDAKNEDRGKGQFPQSDKVDEEISGPRFRYLTGQFPKAATEADVQHTGLEPEPGERSLNVKPGKFVRTSRLDEI